MSQNFLSSDPVTVLTLVIVLSDLYVKSYHPERIEFGPDCVPIA